MTELQILIERLEQATGPDPHLDAEIEAALRGGEPAYRTASRHQFGPSVVLNHGAGNPWDGWESAPSFTGSIDAALSLVPELPRRYVSIEIDADYTAAVITWEGGHANGVHKLPPLALCTACLKAIDSTRGKG